VTQETTVRQVRRGGGGIESDGIERAAVRDGELEVTLRGGQVLRFPAMWLRDSCPCTECADPVGGQKLHDVTDIAPDCAVAAAESIAHSARSSGLDCAIDTLAAEGGAGEEGAAEGGAVTVTFWPDGHRSVFAADWLAAQAAGEQPDRRQLWHTAAELGELPEVSWHRYTADPAQRARALESVLASGLVLLREVPPDEGMVTQVAESFGFVRETNYGRLFDVRIEPAPGNLAFTSREILPHTDNPYRDPVPTLQLLHCLRAADEGGDTGLVDGFAAAAALRQQDPAAYDVLTGTTVRFEYKDLQAELRTSQPLIQLSPDGTVRGVRFNNRSARPPYRNAARFYPAYRRWAELLARPERRLAMRLAPGDCLIFDNTRILHARTAFSVTGSRHLQGCYADIDGLASTLEMIRR
jgi:gamma-butyrobetaine dioxygenase